MKYQVIEAENPTKLNQRVNLLMAEGWRLHEGPFVRNHLVCQCLTQGEYVRPNRVAKKQEKRHAG